MAGKPKNFYAFEGTQRTLREVGELVPCMSKDGILAGLRRGCTTRRELLSYDLPAAKARAGRLGGAPYMRNNYPTKGY